MYRAKVSRVTASGTYVLVPELVPGFAFEAQVPNGLTPAEGDSVLVADVGGPNDPDLIVICVLVLGGT